MMNSCVTYPNSNFSVFATVSTRALSRPISFQLRPIQRRRSLIVVASANGSSIRRREFGGLNAPLEPSTPAGRLLAGVLLDNRDGFQLAARNELERLAVERDEAVARVQLSLGADEACLHRRIAKLTNQECQEAVEDVMYMLILHKFLEMKVYLIPRLSRCVYNGRLEIWPSKTWELESIHSIEVLEMVREHTNAVVGLRVNCNVTDSWTTTEIQRSRLCQLYAASILYGYFLKSASLRHQLEWGLEPSESNHGISVSQPPVMGLFSPGSQKIAFGNISSSRSMSHGQVSYSPGNKQKNLRSYVMGFAPEILQMCAKPKSKEAVNLIERHSCALFGDELTGLLETDQLICTSFASLERFVLEAVAFGSFLWETENCINSVYMLEEN